MSYGRLQMSSAYAGTYGRGSGASTLTGLPLITGSSGGVYTETPVGYGPPAVGLGAVGPASYGSALGKPLFGRKRKVSYTELVDIASQALSQWQEPLPLPPIPEAVILAPSNEIGAQLRIAYWYARAARQVYAQSSLMQQGQYGRQLLANASALKGYAESTKAKAVLTATARKVGGAAVDVGKVEAPTDIANRFLEAKKYIASQGAVGVAAEMNGAKTQANEIQAAQDRNKETPGRDVPKIGGALRDLPWTPIAIGAGSIVLLSYFAGRAGSKRRRNGRRQNPARKGILPGVVQKSIDAAPLTVNDVAAMGAISIGAVLVFSGGATLGMTTILGVPLIWAGFKSFGVTKTEDRTAEAYVRAGEFEAGAYRERPAKKKKKGSRWSIFKPWTWFGSKKKKKSSHKRETIPSSWKNNGRRKKRYSKRRRR